MRRSQAQRMVHVSLQLRSLAADLVLPPGTEILRTKEPEPVADVPAAVAEALSNPIGTRPFAEICRRKLLEMPTQARAATPAGSAATSETTAGLLAAPEVHAFRRPSVVVVISDNTRPVPYKGEGGILWPLVASLLDAGFPGESIVILVATGTHRVLQKEEIWDLIDERVRGAGVRVSCHDAAYQGGLVSVGRSDRGVDVFVNREYAEADFRILTGLVEPHLMAGVSGGRKSICPGLLNVESVREFHGPVTLADDRSTDMVVDGNPCHAISLEIAHMADPDFILNVTIRQDGRVAGVFAGDMEMAHMAAVQHVRTFAQIPLSDEYDVVVTHGGLVGVNHYQAEKAVQVAAKAVREGGYLIVVADTTDVDPLGSESYRRMLRLLADTGPDHFVRTICANNWEFVHDQWGVQVWAKLLAKVPAANIFYFSPQTANEDYDLLPSVPPVELLGKGSNPPTEGAAGEDDRVGAGDRVTDFIRAAVARACAESERATGRKARIAYLADGPHGIPVSGT